MRGDKEDGRARFWRAIGKGVSWSFNSVLIATILGSLVLSGLLWLYHGFSQPPPVTAVTTLMDEEATAAQKHDTSVVGRIYAPDAVVTDAACQTPGQSHTWVGYAQISRRYKGLQGFVWLRHLYAQVTWEPDNSDATTAAVTAETVGVLAPATSKGKQQSIVGHELWTFALTNGHWLVTSFTYNLCLPPSGA